MNDTLHLPFKVKPHKWKAHWIWADALPNGPNVYFYFRHRFDLAGGTDGCRVLVSADSSYRLFLNGTSIGQGPPSSPPFHTYYDEYDVAPFLQAGSNVFAILVNHVGKAVDSRGGLLLELLDGAGTRLVTTDPKWKVKRARAWKQDTHAMKSNKANPFQEFYDARLEPVGWKDVGFDDSAWDQAVNVPGFKHSDRTPCAGPWSRLVPRGIPYQLRVPVLPVGFSHVEEGLDLVNRSRPNDLAPGLSSAGQAIRYSVLQDPENLCREDGVTVARSSLEHSDLAFDGVYSPSVVLDFGKVINGRIRVELEASAGGILDIGYAERLIDGHFNISIEAEYADRYTMKAGPQVFECFSLKAFRYAKLRFRSCYKPVTLRSVACIASVYPYEERGAFASGDETLNGVFEICRYTVRLASMESLIDGWREQAQWGDASQVTVPIIYSCFGETAIIRKFLVQSAASQHPTGILANISNRIHNTWVNSIPDFSLWWIKGLREYFFYTADEEVLHRLYPQALRILDGHLDYINADGLVEDMPFWVFIDWADLERRGVCGAYNAIFYRALGYLQELAKIKGDAYTVGLTEQIRAGIKASFHKVLFDSDRGAFADASLDGALSPKISEQGNMAPIWAGLCDQDMAARTVKNVFEGDNGLKFTESQPFFMSVVLPALEAAGRFDLALDLIRRRWGARFLDRGATSVAEEWYENGSRRRGGFSGMLRSKSHAWSGIPADFLIRNLLGIEILEPGCKVMRVSPKETAFNYRATFPTPLGPVSGSCENQKVSLILPDGVRLQS